MVIFSLYRCRYPFGLLSRKLACFLVLLIVVGCASSPPEPKSPVVVPDTFSVQNEAARLDQWWISLNEESLNLIMDKALDGNLDLKTSWERLREARAVARVAGAELYPELDGELGAFRGGDRTDDGVGDAETVFSAGLTASYEVDVWGRLQAVSDAEQLRAEASYLDVQAAALSLSAEVALTWIRLSATQDIIQLLESEAKVNQDQVELLQNRFAAGQVLQVDVLRQRQLLLGTRRDLHSARSAKQQLLHQLAVLMGRPPQVNLEVEVQGLSSPGPQPETGLPADLIRRRPDVESAWLNLQAANRDTAAAVSAQFPRISLSAGLNSSEDRAEDLFRDWAWSFAANLAAPLYNAGRLKAEADRRRALENQRLYEYGQSVLVAFREVEDALVREQEQLLRGEEVESQLVLARQTLERLRFSFQNGASDFLDVLSARTVLQRLQRELIITRRDRLEARIALHRALAGSFEWNGEKYE